MSLDVLSVLALLFFSEVHPLPSPRNVSVHSYNMGPVVMTWNAPRGPHTQLTYTAQYKTSLRNVTDQVVCRSIAEQRCDFGLVNYHTLYVFSVRAELAGKTSGKHKRPSTSNWKTFEFFIDRQTAIGPPSVTLVSKGGAIELNIQDPVLKNAALRDVYTTVDYLIRYWDEGHPKDVKKKDMTVSEKRTESLVKLRPLVPNTKYCVQVQVYIQDYSIMGEESKTTCEMSSITAEDRKLVLSWVMVAVAAALPLLLLLSWSVYRARRFLNPKQPLPEHFKQRPGVPPSQNSGSPPEKYDQIWELCEERPYHDVQDDSGSEDRLSLSDSSILEETPKYYNAGVVDMAYENIPHGF